MCDSVFLSAQRLYSNSTWFNVDDLKVEKVGTSLETDRKCPPNPACANDLAISRRDLLRNLKVLQAVLASGVCVCVCWNAPF